MVERQEGHQACDKSVQQSLPKNSYGDAALIMMIREIGRLNKSGGCECVLVSVLQIKAEDAVVLGTFIAEYDSGC